MLTHLQVPPVAPARVVILGAKGFVAGALFPKLQAEMIPVRRISSGDIDLTTPDAAIRLQSQIEPDDAVVMTAGLTPDKGRDAATLMKNLRMAEEVAQALVTRPCAHFIYLSSDAVYDWRHPLVSETLAPSPTGLYSLMHIARELVLAQACTAAEIPFCVLRPCAIYGPGDTHNSYGPNRFVRSALAESRIRLFGQGEETRDHVFISDVVTLIRLILLNRSAGTLNAVSGTAITFENLAGLIARLVGRKVTIEFVPRTGKLTHRTFDPTAIHQAFPRFQAATLNAGLMASLEVLAAS